MISPEAQAAMDRLRKHDECGRIDASPYWGSATYRHTAGIDDAEKRSDCELLARELLRLATLLDRYADETVERLAESVIDRCDGIVTMDSDQRRDCKAVIKAALGIELKEEPTP